MLLHFITTCQLWLSKLKSRLKDITQPATSSLKAGVIADLSRSKSDLIIENAILRQQLIILNRTNKRPKITKSDRLLLVLLSRLSTHWQSALHIVQPDTILRWHRELFRAYWRKKSTPKNREPLWWLHNSSTEIHSTKMCPFAPFWI
jgi:hypothetical protein